MEVGVRELKAHLSEFLRRAADGETIVVTDRGTPTAVIGPVHGRDLVGRGVQQGWIRPPSRRGLTPFVAVTASRRTSDVLDEDRGQ